MVLWGNVLGHRWVLDNMFADWDVVLVHRLAAGTCTILLDEVPKPSYHISRLNDLHYDVADWSTLF